MSRFGILRNDQQKQGASFLTKDKNGNMVPGSAPKAKEDKMVDNTIV